MTIGYQNQYAIVRSRARYPFVATSLGVCADIELTAVQLVVSDTKLGLDSKLIKVQNASAIKDVIEKVIVGKFNMTCVPPALHHAAACCAT